MRASNNGVINGDDLHKAGEQADELHAIAKERLEALGLGDVADKIDAIRNPQVHVPDIESEIVVPRATPEATQVLTGEAAVQAPGGVPTIRRPAPATSPTIRPQQSDRFHPKV
jgi:hypothetical protein